MMRYSPGSKKRRCLDVLPAPGPPWRNTAGIPSGRPHSSQYMECSASRRSMPLARGSISGNSPAAPRSARSPMLGCEDRRPGRLTRLEVAVRLRGVLQRVPVVDLDLHLPGGHDVEEVLRAGDEVVALRGVGHQGRPGNVERAL